MTAQRPARTPRAPGRPEDVREAANMRASISTYVSTVALAVLGAEGALYTYYLEHRLVAPWATGAFIVAALAIVVSIFLGGKGTNTLSSRGYYGDWDIFALAGTFSAQSLFALLSVVLLAAVMFWGTGPLPPPKADTAANLLRRLNNQQYAQKLQILQLQRQLRALRKEAPPP